MCCIQHCFICRPSDSTVSEDAGIEPKKVEIFRPPPPLKCPELWIVPLKTTKYKAHINNRYIGSFMYQPWTYYMRIYMLMYVCLVICNMQTKGGNGGGGREGGEL
jgi:hypothetical protein